MHGLVHVPLTVDLAEPEQKQRTSYTRLVGYRYPFTLFLEFTTLQPYDL